MPNTLQRFSVPQGTPWDAVERGRELPAGVQSALERAKGALVRTVYSLRDGDRWIVALGLHRPYTVQEKLTELSGDPHLLRSLADELAVALLSEGVVSIKLELRHDARAWQEVAREAGFVSLARPISAGRLPHNPDTVPRGLIRRLVGSSPSEVAYYRQTTDFTCGPVAVLTALHALNLAPAPTRPAELQFWREATSAPGCDAYGLAAALAVRGVVPDVVVNTTEALQVDDPADWLRELREFTQTDFRARAERLGVRFRLREFDISEVFRLVGEGNVVVLLIDEAPMHGVPCAHWVVVHAVLGDVAFVEDPWTDDELGESWVDAHELAVTKEGLVAMSGWGSPAYRSMLVLSPGV